MNADGTAGLTIALGSPTLAQCSISVDEVDGDQVVVSYTGLPGNQPHSYGDFVGVWSGSMISPGIAPIGRASVPTDNESGSVVVEGLTIAASSYTAGYAVGGALTDVCACQLIGAGGQLGPPRAIGVSLNTVTADVVSVHYETLPGFTPQTAGSWIGLWRGEIDPYVPGSTEVVSRTIPSDVNEGDLALATPIAINSVYTLVFYMGAETTTAAASLTFNTA
jgi:hypothetical protein